MARRPVFRWWTGEGVGVVWYGPHRHLRKGQGLQGLACGACFVERKEEGEAGVRT